MRALRQPGRHADPADPGMPADRAPEYPDCFLLQQSANETSVARTIGVSCRV